MTKTLVAIKQRRGAEIFEFNNRKNALTFIKDLKKIQKNIKYAISGR